MSLTERANFVESPVFGGREYSKPEKTANMGLDWRFRRGSALFIRRCPRKIQWSFLVLNTMPNKKWRELLLKVV
jgi:hypothetical protein